MKTNTTPSRLATLLFTWAILTSSSLLAQSSTPKLSELTIEQVRQRIYELDSLLPSTPAGPAEASSESTTDRIRLEKLYTDLQDPRVKSMLAELEQLEKQFYVDNSVKAKFVGYDAGTEVLSANVDGSTQHFVVPMSIAKAVRDSWNRVKFARSGSASLASVALLWVGEIYPSRGSQPYSGPVYKISPAEGISPPTPVIRPEPDYTNQARKAKLQGEVWLAVVIDEQGAPHQIELTRKLGLGLDEKAIETVRKWRFRPGMKDGKPVAVKANISISFHLI